LIKYNPTKAVLCTLMQKLHTVHNSKMYLNKQTCWNLNSTR